MKQVELAGVVTPLLTPYENDRSIAMSLYLEHARANLADGAHFLSPFGTTGEATSNSPSERMAVLEALVAEDVARPEQLMPGTGMCSLEETLTLSRHAAELGVAAIMVLPPFFYSNPSEDGLYRYFSELIEALGASAVPICLYNIPQNTGVPVTPALSARLAQDFPGVVAAYKDSSGDFANALAVMRAAPDLAVFPASEVLMARGMDAGGAGCISATCNSNVAAIRSMYDDKRSGKMDADLQTALETHRAAVQEAGLIGGLKALKAHQTGDARWLNMRAPHEDAYAPAGAALAGTLPS